MYVMMVLLLVIKAGLRRIDFDGAVVKAEPFAKPRFDQAQYARRVRTRIQPRVQAPWMGPISHTLVLPRSGSAGGLRPRDFRTGAE